MLDSNLIKIKTLTDEAFYGKYEIEPLDRGYGQTLGIALRRVLLSSLEGSAVTSVKIVGVKHEYSTLTGLEEDILHMILNIKQLRVMLYGDEPQILKLQVKKAGDILASDIEENGQVEILNKDFVIAHLADNKNPLSLEIKVEKGIGYQNIEATRDLIGEIPLAPDFSPVERVSFTVGSARLGNITDLDKLTIEIFTKSIAPIAALRKAIEIFETLLVGLKDQIPEETVVEEPKKAKKSDK